MSEYESEPLELFLYAIKSDATKDRYKRRLGNFFDFLELDGDLAEHVSIIRVFLHASLCGTLSGDGSMGARRLLPLPHSHGHFQTI